MKNRKHTPEQIIRKLAEGEKLLGEGKTIEEVSRHLEITESTWHRWRNQYGGMKADDAKKLKELEKENQRLKRIVADQALDIDMLKELNRETSDPGLPPAGRRGPAGAVRGDRTASVPGGRPTPLHPAAQAPGPERRRAGPSGLPPGLLQAPSPLGLATGGRGGQEGRMAGQPQADPPPLDRRRPACAL